MGREIPCNLQMLCGTRTITLDVDKISCIGWSGRDWKNVMGHIEELARIGVPRPTEVPTFYTCSRVLATTDNEIQVIGGETSGEAEFLLYVGDQVYVGLGSDHTDRSLEATDIAKAKQICPKPIAPTFWVYDELKEHWDSVILRSYVTTTDGKRQLYQEEMVASILPVDRLLEAVSAKYGSTDHLLIFSGTIPTKSGLIYGMRFEVEMEDPVIGRRISHWYDITVF